MDICPIKDSAWKKLVGELGETLAYTAFSKNDYVTPTIEEANVLLGLSKESRILRGIKDRLIKIKKIYDKKKNSSKVIEITGKLDELNTKLSTIDELQGILSYIEETSSIVGDFERNMEVIKSNPGDVHAIDRLVSINGFISSFDNLKDIQKIGLLDNTETEGIIDKTVKRIDKLHNDYLEVGIPLIAKKLFSLMDKDVINANKSLKTKLLAKNPNDSYALSLIVDEKDLIREMQLASRDISGYERWLCSSLGGTSPIISLTSKLVADNSATLYDDLYKDEEEIGEAYEKFKKDRKIDNVKELNSKFIELRISGDTTTKHFIGRSSARYKALTPEEKEYYDILMDKMNEFRALLPPKILEQMGDRIPSVYKDDWEFLSEGKVKKVVSDKFNINASDTNYGIVDTEGRLTKELPLFFTQKMSGEDVSDDLLQSILKAGKNWREYDYKSRIHSEVQLIRDITALTKVTDTNAKGEARYDKVLDDNVITKDVTSNIEKRLNETLDNIYYGQEDEKTIFNIAGKDISADKLTNTLLTATSTVSLTANWVAGISNIAMGNIMNAMEVFAGEFVAKGSAKEAYKIYAKNIHNFIADRGKITGKHWITKVSEEYDLMQGSYINEFGENISGSRLKREMDTSNAFFINNGGEHQIQITGGLMHLNSVKYIDGKFVSKVDYKGDIKEFNKAKSLLKYLEENDGKLPSEVKNAWGVTDRQKLRHRIHELNKYSHGNYSSFDKTSLQRVWYGKLAIMYRKFIVPGAARRFGRERVNLGTGTILEGSYNTTVKFLYDTIIEMKNLNFNAALGLYGKLSINQQANIKRTTVEAFSLFLMMAIVSGLDDDDDNSYVHNLLLLEARRLQSELSFYTPSLEPLRILKSPTVTMSTVESIAKFSHGVMFEWGEDMYYKRDTGVWKKGDSKTLARLTKLIPGLKAILAGLTPEEQYKTFNKLL